MLNALVLLGDALDESVHQMVHDTVSVNMSACQTPMQLCVAFCLPVTPCLPSLSATFLILFVLFCIIHEDTVRWVVIVSGIVLSIIDEMDMVVL